MCSGSAPDSPQVARSPNDLRSPLSREQVITDPSPSPTAKALQNSQAEQHHQRWIVLPGSECGPGTHSSIATGMLCNTTGQTVARRRPEAALLLATHLHRSQPASQATSQPPCWGSWRYSCSGLRASRRSEDRGAVADTLLLPCRAAWTSSSLPRSHSHPRRLAQHTAGLLRACLALELVPFFCRLEAPLLLLSA